MTDVDMAEGGGIAIRSADSPPTAVKLADSINAGAMDMTTPNAAASIAESTTGRLPITVEKPTPYTFDLGNLLAIDPNPLPRGADEATLSATARDAAQVLINQLLTTCEIKSTSDGVLLQLPTPTTPLPREKPIPTEKPPTKWELFAKKKGIKDKKRDGKMVYDEATGEWVPKWGYKGKNKDGDTQWLVEVDAKKELETGEAGDSRAEGRRERKEKVRRNERKQRSNERNARKNG
ncbi:ribosome biogenesis regulatory protein-domain-containing protein [Clohesyomyces aquaticus]|uniref:Ribosome biogenesis regulatory protein n=1 Tax=Clohesyomyces aquaticus TaxID=1231657 RepID=A0A1Y1ZMJ7_9PLEO|nr:ribosome biogenesis regulatory protein-domain-containing protein [Clohesyomyces aquaticus]